MSNPIGTVAPPYTASPYPLRNDTPMQTTTQAEKSEDTATVFPLGRPTIPLPVEAFLPYREPAAQNAPKDATEQATEQIIHSMKIVDPTEPDPNAVDLRIPLAETTAANPPEQASSTSQKTP